MSDVNKKDRDARKERGTLIGNLFQWQAAGVGERGYNHFLMFPVDFVSVKRQGALSLFGTGEEKEIDLDDLASGPFVAFSVGIAEYFERNENVTISGGKQAAAVAFKDPADRKRLIGKIYKDPFLKTLVDNGTPVMVSGDWKDGELHIDTDKNLIPLHRREALEADKGAPAPQES